MQAPWRKQSQIAGLILVIVVFITIFATVYLHISAKAAEVGRQIQVMQNDMDDLDRTIEDLRSQLAIIRSSDEMERRASALGFKPVQMEEVTFLAIPGYIEPPVFVFQHMSQPKPATNYKIPSEYTESLFDWLQRKAALYLAVR